MSNTNTTIKLGVNSVARNTLVGVQNRSCITVRSGLVSVVSFMSHRIPTNPLNKLLFTILYVTVHDFDY
jgi:hypothetical protein